MKKTYTINNRFKVEIVVITYGSEIKQESYDWKLSHLICALI